MGTCCVASEGKKKNNDVDRELNTDKRIDQNKKKLLFLGSGGSGKSTLFKQLRTIHGDGFADKDRIAFRDHIYSQIIEQMKAIVEGMMDLREDEPDDFGHLELSEDGDRAAEAMEALRNDEDINDESAQIIAMLWKEPAIQEVFEERARLKFDDSSAYFFADINRIGQSNFIPTEQDILYVRHRTTGVIEQQLEIKGTQFHIFDVGGQRSERKKWIHCFEHVTAVIFVTSLSSYNEIMFEDEEQNSLLDSLDLFEEICNLRWFEQTAMILFLNKKDLFAQKLLKFPLSVCFEEYEGDDSYDSGVAYIRNQFEEKNKNPREKQIYSHVTCATDKTNVEKVFGDVQHIVINTSLARGGLI